MGPRLMGSLDYPPAAILSNRGCVHQPYKAGGRCDRMFYFHSTDIRKLINKEETVAKSWCCEFIVLIALASMMVHLTSGSSLGKCLSSFQPLLLCLSTYERYFQGLGSVQQGS